MFWKVVGAIALFVLFFAIMMHGLYRQIQLCRKLGVDYARVSTWTAEFRWKSLLLGLPYTVAFSVFVLAFLLFLF